MSKVLNLKGVKLFAVIVLAVAILATFGMVAVQQASAQQANVSASDIQYAATVRSGSSGQAVIIWQKFFNDYSSANLVADGKFGPLTATAARTWQAARGLAADGILGPLSRASAMAQINAGVSVTYPAGCTSASGFSTVTGLPCTASPVAGLPAGCSSTAGFSPTSGVRCDSGSTLPAGCTTTAGYSPTSGAKCDGTTAGPISASGEGSVAVTYAPVPADNLAVNRGESKDVMGVEVKATGSDMKVTRVWLDINKRIWLSASEIALLDGGNVVSTIALSASTVVEVTSGSAWQVQFNGLNITVPVNTTKVLTVRITRPELTSANESITLAATSTLRATDMAGFSETYTLTPARTLNMADVAAAAGTLTNTLSANNPKARSVSGLSTTAGVTTAVELLRFDLKAEDGPMNVTHVSGTVTPTGCTSAECLASVELRDGSTVLASAVGANAIAFNNLSIDIATDSTKTLSVWGQVNPIISGSLEPGESVIVAIDDVDATTGTTFTDASITTTVTGEAQYFFRYAPTFALVSTSAANTGADNKDGTFSIVFDVTAPAGSDIYVAKAVTATTANGTNEVDKIAAAGVGGTLAPSQSSTNTIASDGGDTLGAKVSAGTTGRFTIVGYIPAGGGTPGFTGMELNEINWATTDNNAVDFDQSWGLLDFKTPTVYVLGA